MFNAIAIDDKLTLTDAEFEQISDRVYDHCGINLHDGKKELVRARLAKIIRQGRFDSFSQYMEHVAADASGQAFSDLIDSLSTNLTSFFRESIHFDYLARSYLPELVAHKQRSGQLRLRAWSAGCSSGEEPYTIAITLLESLPDRARWDIKLLATDISTRILKRAREGIYERERIEPVPPALKNRYLTMRTQNGQKQFEVASTLRNIITFKYLNLMQEWPFRGPFDFIFCRNVMIYFDKPTQQRLIDRFWKVLAPGGVLFTGHSESLTGIRHQFQYVQPTIYRKR
ncbi:MAG: protein-glutamate O-methyltransferase [Phycisphaerae bacterium]|nr:protein-glutamate O-methyltransferase [Phycisphaerae bacterium]